MTITNPRRRGKPLCFTKPGHKYRGDRNCLVIPPPAPYAPRPMTESELRAKSRAERFVPMPAFEGIGLLSVMAFGLSAWKRKARAKAIEDKKRMTGKKLPVAEPEGQYIGFKLW